MTSKQPCIYIATDKTNTVLYTGVTSNLAKRMWQHRKKASDCFTAKYNVTKLVYFETLETMENAILREKQIKAGSRKKKLDLIRKKNFQFDDLYSRII